ncbi:hypothetical protein MYSTI_05320 [Myxococcus stipitatus DSM 14675]|uniref:Lipoprotein n=1 Tax=Myxococcus stipitatus (strain DSM 14675 / JCM 12634 / Mx s8) TaxID=1278073 RepID=L7UJH7_MYXSD|nr:hypothetical protein [Myxococcus stipitatus]AGC46599.1 hypothetical protein MYSTI_05320 [Myxococcus stipitatus DSM 14675]
MRLRLILGFALVAAQLGCGGAEAPSELATREDPLLRCATDHYIVFYSDASHTTEVGTELCVCDRTPARTGTRSAYPDVVYSYECSGARATTP